MNRKCLICGSSEEEVKKLHYFPTSIEKSKLWQESLGMKFMGESLRNRNVCSNHFSPQDYNGVRLRNDAVPERFIPPSKILRPVGDPSNKETNPSIPEPSLNLNLTVEPLTTRFEDSRIQTTVHSSIVNSTSTHTDYICSKTNAMSRDIHSETKRRKIDIVQPEYCNEILNEADTICNGQISLTSSAQTSDEHVLKVSKGSQTDSTIPIGTRREAKLWYLLNEARDRNKLLEEENQLLRQQLKNAVKLENEQF